MAKLSMHRTVEGLGDYLREQRGLAQMSLRQLSELTDVSNPYLSQIERGLRRPSAEVLQQIAKALRISAESLYVRAGILDADEHGARMVEDAIALDPLLTERQKGALLDIYRSFVGTDQATDTELATTVTAANHTDASRPGTAPTEEIS
ncbi:helix-turn-helix domain-containing protein [Aeromicrobium endophyticum]|uniref:XRE family transcriptional regulator n=1 Tax=Aeromicrobium endophyticum TaxID=2292704 RepID=A0A371PCX3_9ACTN|nr:helix-turn-helix transcriptional regulator [Aeromicrobium endophyticum]REK73747.1 XRE family transcriptional regulator [Aeromicrobium endophyticum]